jgi:fumarate hydratase subunit alpha
MRIIEAGKITKAIVGLCLKANYSLRSDVLDQIKSAYKKETNKKAKSALGAIIDNAGIARKERLAICQDTGLPLVFVEIGQDVKVSGDFKKAVMKGIALGYKAGNFRESIVCNPLLRGKPAYEGAIIHTDIVKGNKIKITVMPKGFGCENKSQLKMFLPTAGIDEIKDFVIQVVKAAGPDACPPYVVGVGIGGAADYASLLAKKALLRSLYIPTIKLEKDLLKEINALHIGPMGLGGKTTCLAVNVETYPTHIAGLPVAVNISCHALRSAKAVL